MASTNTLLSSTETTSRYTTAEDTSKSAGALRESTKNGSGSNPTIFLRVVVATCKSREKCRLSLLQPCFGWRRGFCNSSRFQQKLAIMTLTWRCYWWFIQNVDLLDGHSRVPSAKRWDYRSLANGMNTVFDSTPSEMSPTRDAQHPLRFHIQLSTSMIRKSV